MSPKDSGYGFDSSTDALSFDLAGDDSLMDLGETKLLDLHSDDMHGAIADPTQVPRAPDGSEEPVSMGSSSMGEVDVMNIDIDWPAPGEVDDFDL